MQLFVSCVRTADGFYKLQFSFNEYLLPDTKHLSNPEVQESFANKCSYYIGYWVTIFKNQSILIKEIDIILPPFGEYLDLIEKLDKEIIEKHQVHVSVLTGITLNTLKEGNEPILPRVEQQINRLREFDTSNN